MSTPSGVPRPHPHTGDALPRSTAASEPPTVRPAPAAPTERDGAPAVRASDAERQDTVAVMHRAHGQGRLDLDETDARVAAAYAARYRHELSALLADLPDADGSGRRSSAPGWGDVWWSTVWRLRVVVFGPEAGPPTVQHRRWAAAATALAVLWTLFCAVLAAVAVAA